MGWRHTDTHDVLAELLPAFEAGGWSVGGCLGPGVLRVTSLVWRWEGCTGWLVLPLQVGWEEVLGFGIIGNEAWVHFELGEGGLRWMGV